jgi:hypothetical protein
MSKWVTTLRAAGDFLASVLMAKAIFLDFWREKGAFTDPASSCNLPLCRKALVSLLPPQEQWEVIGSQRFPEKGDKRAEKTFEGDPFMLKMESLFKEWCTPEQYENSTPLYMRTEGGKDAKGALMSERGYDAFHKLP